jgi:hypothetical protein
MKTITALTDVLYREVRHPAGTGFEVVDEITDKSPPNSVDATTAGRWVRQGWAEEMGAESDEGRGEPSPGADAPPFPASGRGKK